jgi:predicted nucleic acid-binding protein
MTRFVVDSGVLLRIAAGEIDVHREHELVAPSLVRSQALAAVHASFRRGELDRKQALELLDRVATTKVRLLNDRVSRRRAFEIAERQGWAGTDEAEYVAIAQLQADALVTAVDEFGRRAAAEVTVAPVDALRGPR